jgi:exonuclease VII large subunit
MEYAGAGALLARIEMLRLRLAAEGLFDADRKRALPVLPSVIGLITSEHGAVIQDIRTTITRRFPRQVFACGQGASWPRSIRRGGPCRPCTGPPIRQIRLKEK